LPAVFIRAPVATGVGDGVEVLSQLDDHRIVAARQGHWLATAFHPELSGDSRMHAYFLGMAQGAAPEASGEAADVAADATNTEAKS
jgi:5'-phosphate synthase pdxT subunit